MFQIKNRLEGRFFIACLVQTYQLVTFEIARKDLS